jgi:phenylpyruvate tautomerase PptA (4-oxalocrotonate tautomerase family)
MPLVKIEIRKGKSSEYKKALLDGVHRALVQTIKILDHDRTQRLYELDADNFEAAPNKTDNITVIEIVMFKGRSIEAKKQLYKTIVNNLAENPGIKGDDIIIVLGRVPYQLKH